MHQPRHAPGRVLHPQRNVQPELNRERQRHTFVLDPTAQVWLQAFRPADVFEHDVGSPADVLDEPRLHDIAVLFQPNPGHGLLHEARHCPLVIQEAALETLERDRFALFVVVAQIDDAHPAPAHVSDFVASFDPVANFEFVFLLIGLRARDPGAWTLRLDRRVGGRLEQRRLIAILCGKRDLLEARIAQKFLLVGRGSATQHAELCHRRFALKDAAVLIGNGVIVGMAGRSAIQVNQLTNLAFADAVFFFRQRPKHDGNVAPRRISLGSLDQPVEIMLRRALSQRLVNRAGRGFARALIRDQRFADVKDQQPPIV